MKPNLVLMNGALRLDDHPSLVRACASGSPVIPAYILDDETAGDWKLGGARRWWLLQSLGKLGDDLARLGSRLIIRKGTFGQTLCGLIEEIGADTIYLTRGYDPISVEQQDDANKIAGEFDAVCRRFGGNLLLEPEEIRTKTGGKYEVFTPFWRQARELISNTAPLDPPDHIPAPKHWPESTPLDALDLHPKPAHWAEPIARFWAPGETAAHERLAAFLDEASAGYRADRDIPGLDGTSRLSPYLANGEISPRRIWFETHTYADANPAGAAGAEAFLREIGWREFSTHLLFHNPNLPTRPLKGKFAAFPWREGISDDVIAWQRGMTGFPIVDAGMRQLWQTGWMHNRVRMIVASFLVKDMLWHWRTGEDWFWDTLVDADLANNAASWQWVAGCGADAAPYFRIFNPITQGEKFDRKGAYIRTFVPELGGLPDDFIHKPFEAPAGILEMAGITLGQTYPKPILDRKKGRERALAALASIKEDAS